MILILLVVIALVDVRLALRAMRLRALPGSPRWLGWIILVLLVSFAVGAVGCVWLLQDAFALMARADPSTRINALSMGISQSLYPLYVALAGSLAAVIGLTIATARAKAAE